MKHIAIFAIAVAAIYAFPTVLQNSEVLPHLRERDYAQPGCTVSKQCNAYLAVSDAQAHIPSTDNAATLASKARNNCGAAALCKTFDAQDQYVSTSGPYAYKSPG
ncbi:hypothetical protein M409DRAFT_56117 [Zasmidium cellare ATCC 36951]|uniref:Uncharacterized protein n=1 Tax=Zasmidium cellare ATCC 36951 TaxID=1080233 RepID=A0A6A6CDT5_ZASCE|nr:uncharacterized protein M409DRAFT_56117 [Zasmidium cellare ATCC 36951]KAF2165245.1 hypothetical protein M409DRAFT_56117 [Zasmidium cellare ATCC 36951]